MNRLLIYFSYNCCLCLCFLACQQTDFSQSQLPPSADSAKASISIRLSFVGDLMCHKPQLQSALDTNQAYNFAPSFAEISPYLQEADLCFGNLETTFSGTDSWRKYTGHPSFNTPDSYAKALKQAGFDVLFTANNHAADYGEHGILRTIEVLDRNQVLHTGTAADSLHPYLIVTVKGVKLAILAYTDLSNGKIPASKPFLLNQCSQSNLQADVQDARAKGADLVLVHFHFGEEYERFPTESQTDWSMKAILAGADMVIGEHPHVLQPIETYEVQHGRLDKGVLAYSLGNFFAHQRGKYTSLGGILSVEIEADTSKGHFHLRNTGFFPTIVALSHQKHLILAADSSLIPAEWAELPPMEQTRFRQSFQEMQHLFIPLTDSI